MPSNDIRFETSGTVHARPETVWAILVDYDKGHPAILPPDAFSHFKVMSGGQGAGSTVTFVFKAGGVKRDMHVTVSVPEPGRTLVETTTDGTATTTFQVSPLDEGRSTHLTITTVQAGHSGVVGAIERLATPLLAPTMQRIYQDEMRLLEEVARRWPLV